MVRRPNRCNQNTSQHEKINFVKTRGRDPPLAGGVHWKSFAAVQSRGRSYSARGASLVSSTAQQCCICHVYGLRAFKCGISRGGLAQDVRPSDTATHRLLPCRSSGVERQCIAKSCRFGAIFEAQQSGSALRQHSCTAGLCCQLCRLTIC